MQISLIRTLWRWGNRSASGLANRPGNLGGMILMVISTGCMSAMYVAIRSVPQGIHPFEIVFFRNLFGLLILVSVNIGNLPALYGTSQFKLHGLRSLLNVVAMLSFFMAVLITPLSDVSALSFTAPLFASLLAVLLLKETLRGYRILGLAIGFVGTLIVLRPGVGDFSTGHGLLLLSGFTWSGALMVIKVLGRKDSSQTITLYSGVFMTPISLAAAAWFWQWPNLEQLLWMSLVALLGTAGQVALAQSFRIAEASAVLPLDFFKLIWSTGFGFLLFSEIPDTWTLLGGVTIFSSTTYLALKEIRPKADSEHT